MNKNLNMIGFFSRIALAILSFAVIVCIFIPYMRIPAVSTQQDVNTETKALTRAIGFDQNTFNISEFSDATCPPFQLYSDAELTQTVNTKEVPLPQQDNTYYFATYVYAYPEGSSKKGEPQKIMLEKYTVTISKDVKNNSKVKVERNIVDKTIKIRAPKATTFDFTRVIDTKTAWYRQKSNVNQPFNEITNDIELKSISIEPGSFFTCYAAITLKSEVDPYAALQGISEDEAKTVYFPLEIYSVFVSRDAERKTLPIVGEIGGGILSAKETEAKGALTVSPKNTGMFIFMCTGAIATLLSLIIPNKFRIIQVIISCLLGIGLIVVPVIDLMFYTTWNFNIEAGVFVLMGLGLINIVVSIFDYIISTKTYKSELIHLYGEDYFSKERKAAMRAERKEKDRLYKIEKKAAKAEAKEAKKKK